jgi:Fe-S cluster assembly scaffold protein SufB
MSTALLRHFRSTAQELIQHGLFKTPSEEWRYFDQSIWNDDVFANAGTFFDGITWNLRGQGTIAWTPLSQVSGYDWINGQLAQFPGAVAALAHASDAIVIESGSEAHIELDISIEDKAQQLPIFIEVAKDHRVTVGISVHGNSPANICIFSRVGESGTLIINEIRNVTSPLFTGSVLITQDKNSTAQWRGVEAGNTIGLRGVRINQAGVGAQSAITGLNLGTGTSQNYFHTHLDHQVEEGNSRQLFKSILTDRSVSEFKGAVYVDQKAQRTDSSQSNQNMLLSDNARALSRPQLNIFADDVKCAHGATMSQLNEAQVVYLRSRGLSHADAQSILMIAFADDVLDQFEVDSVAALAREVARQFFKDINAK